MAEWKQVNLQEIAEFISRGRSPKYVEKSTLKVINQKCIYWDRLRLENVKFVDEKSRIDWKDELFLRQNDILLNSTGTGTIGRASIFPYRNQNYVIDSHVTVIRLNYEFDPAYIKNYLEYSPIQQQLAALCFTGSTSQVELSKIELQKFPVTLPPFHEQRKIAAILTSVDDAIEKTEAIIAQTEKVKKGLMQKFLTQGIGHTKFKQTEIGDIPEEWEIQLLDNIGKWNGGGTPSKQDPDNWSKSSGLMWVSPKDMYKQTITQTEDYITKKGLQDKKLKVLPEKTVLFVTRSGILRNMVPIAFSGDRLTINQDIKALEIFPQYNKQFVLYTLLAMNEKIKQKCVKSGTTVESIDFKTLKNFPIPVPPHKEQKEIASIISAYYEKIELEYNYLNKLQTLKKGLMQVLLTGKVRVKVDVEDEVVPT